MLNLIRKSVSSLVVFGVCCAPVLAVSQDYHHDDHGYQNDHHDDHNGPVQPEGFLR